MKELTVKQLAAISGVTVSTLHHYDGIGLLKPASVGRNGYRYYGRKELLRLQRILFHRELGVPLSRIAELLALEGDNQIPSYGSIARSWKPSESGTAPSSKR